MSYSSAFKLEQRRILIIDDLSFARSALRNIAQMAGATHIETANSYTDAFARIRKSGMHDIVLCDYNLGGGRDGQQLYAELRHAQLIRQRTLWLMVTAEASLDRVMAVLDLAPDSYLLKPFTTDQFKTRLFAIGHRKAVFERYFGLQEQGAFQDALLELNRITSKHPELGKEGFRYLIETLLSAGRTDEVQRLIQSKSHTQRPPWLSLILAKCQLSGLDYAAALATVQSINSDHPYFLESIEFEADLLNRLGRGDAAQKVLESLVLKNPLNWRRQKSLGQIAFTNGDFATSAKATEAFIRYAIVPDAVEEADYQQLACAYHHEGRTDEACRVLSSAGLADGEQGKLLVLAMRATEEKMAAEASGAVASTRHQEAFISLRPSILAEEYPSASFGYQIVETALAMGDLHLAEIMAERLLARKETARSFVKLKALFTRYGQEIGLKEVQRRAAKSLLQTPVAA